MSEAQKTETMKDPDELLTGVTRKGLGGSLALSFVAHVLLIGLTSFGIYAAWAKWGVHTPNEIKQLEKAAAKEAAEAAKAAAQTNAVARAEGASPAAAESAKASAPEQKPAEKAPAAAKAADDKTPPLEREVAKPVKSFDLDALDL